MITGKALPWQEGVAVQIPFHQTERSNISVSLVVKINEQMWDCERSQIDTHKVKSAGKDSGAWLA